MNENKNIMKKKKKERKEKYTMVNYTNLIHVNISNGNEKLGKGIYTISTMPTDDYVAYISGKLVSNVKGTCKGCKHCKKDCYAVKFVRQYEDVARTYSENTLIARNNPKKYFKEINEFLEKNWIGCFRWHVAGDVISDKYFEGMIDVAKKNIDTLFYVYTQRHDIINKYIKNGGMIPTNLTIIYSSWGKTNNPYDFPEFVVDLGNDEEVKKLPHCPEYNDKGRRTGASCSQCRLCMHLKKGEKIACYKH